MLRLGLSLMFAMMLQYGILAYAAEETGGDSGRPHGRSLPPAGQLDKQANGTPTPGKVDAAAVAELERLSELFQQDGKEREVIEGALSLLQTFESGEDYDHLVDCLFLLGEASQYLGDWAAAEKYMKRAAELGFRYFPDDMSTYPLKVIGDCQFELKRPEDALATFTERVQRIRKQEDSDDLAGALFDVGSMQLHLGRLAEARQSFLEARQANEAWSRALAGDPQASQDELNGNAVDQGEILFHLALVSAREDKASEVRSFLDEALSAFLKASPEAQEEVRDRIVAVLDDLVQTCEKLGDSAGAAGYSAQRDALNQ
jgi:tetratricopeptide (TPR) repeat protein